MKKTLWEDILDINIEYWYNITSYQKTDATRVMIMKTQTVAVLGATGAVGQEMIKILEERNFPVGKLIPLASARSAGKTLKFRGEDVTIQLACDEAFEGVDIVLGALCDFFIPVSVLGSL